MKKLLLLLSFVCLCSSLLAENISENSYGNAVVKKVYDSNDTEAYVFRCDIKNYPPIIGRNIPVRINGIVEPNNITVEQKTAINQTILEKLKTAKKIQLKNMKRDEDFCIIADVYIDNKNMKDVVIIISLETPSKPQTPVATKSKPQPQNASYVGSKKSKVFHKNKCRWIDGISKENLTVFAGRSEAVNQGRRPCKTCKP